MQRPEIQSLIHRCDRLRQEIETLLAERGRSSPGRAARPSQEQPRLDTPAHGEDIRTIWATTLSSKARALLGDLREAGLDDRFLPEADPRSDPHSAEKWQAASEARDFLRTDWVDETGMAHLARYFRLAIDRLRQRGD